MSRFKSCSNIGQHSTGDLSDFEDSVTEPEQPNIALNNKNQLTKQSSDSFFIIVVRNSPFHFIRIRQFSYLYLYLTLICTNEWLKN